MMTGMIPLSLATTASDSGRDDSLLERSEVVFSEPKVGGLLEPGAGHLPGGGGGVGGARGGGVCGVGEGNGRGRRAGLLPDVAKMEATDFGKCHDPTRLRPFDGPHVWRILVEREMGPGAVIVRNVRSQDATQVWLPSHTPLVQTLRAG